MSLNTEKDVVKFLQESNTLLFFCPWCKQIHAVKVTGEPLTTNNSVVFFWNKSLTKPSIDHGNCCIAHQEFTNVGSAGCHIYMKEGVLYFYIQPIHADSIYQIQYMKNSYMLSYMKDHKVNLIQDMIPVDQWFKHMNNKPAK